MVRMQEKHRFRGARRYQVILADAARIRSRYPCCVYCKTRVVTVVDALRIPNGMTVDHVRPRSTARDDQELQELLSYRNIVTSCFACNERKANLAPEQYFTRRELLELLKHMRERVLPPARIGRLVELSRDRDTAMTQALTLVRNGASWQEILEMMETEC